jgi:hypothetical protein
MKRKKSLKRTGKAVPKIFECIPTYGIAPGQLLASHVFRQLFTSAADRGVVKKWMSTLKCI